MLSLALNVELPHPELGRQCHLRLLDRQPVWVGLSTNLQFAVAISAIIQKSDINTLHLYR